MIEKIILDYLSDRLECPVYMEVPSDMPDEFVIIEKTGSSISNRIRSAMVAIQTYSTSMYDTAALNEAVISLMENIVELDDIGSCKLNSDYNFTDTSTKHYRYQAVFDLTHY